MEPVAACDEITVDAVLRAVHGVGDVRRVTIGVVDRHAFGVVDDRSARLFARLIQVAGHFGLAIDHNGRVGVVLEVDAEKVIAIGNQRAVMDKAFFLHPFAYTGLVHHLDHAGFQNACTDAAQHIILGLAFEDDRVDALSVQKLAQKQAGWPAADNGDLSAHDVLPFCVGLLLLTKKDMENEKYTALDTEYRK